MIRSTSVYPMFRVLNLVICLTPMNLADIEAFMSGSLQ